MKKYARHVRYVTRAVERYRARVTRAADSPPFRINGI